MSTFGSTDPKKVYQSITMEIYNHTDNVLIRQLKLNHYLKGLLQLENFINAETKLGCCL